ncbi:MAG: hypothetical protein R3A80_01160 [Bdellovibrionota bacterium]
MIDSGLVELPEFTFSFHKGAKWMHKALEQHRGGAFEFPNHSYNFLGCLKYFCSSLILVLFLAFGLFFSYWPLIALSIPAFYIVEVQLIFLFPVAIDGSKRPLQDAWKLRRKSTSLIEILPITMLIAAHMLSAVFMPQKAIYRWCTGCLAILLIYEGTRNG